MTTLLWQKETVSVCIVVWCGWVGMGWDGMGWSGVVIWVSSREWNKRSKGDSLPNWDRKIIFTQSVTIKGRLSQNFQPAKTKCWLTVYSTNEVNLQSIWLFNHKMCFLCKHIGKQSKFKYALKFLFSRMVDQRKSDQINFVLTLTKTNSC